MQIKDTSKDYDDLVGYKAEELVKSSSLSPFLKEESEFKPEILPKPVDPEFPEDWQNLYLNFTNEEDYIKFMKKIDEVPIPSLKKFVYSRVKDNGILNFLGD